MSTADPAKEEIIILINRLLDRSGLSIEQVLARMQAAGCDISRNSFENRFTTRVHQKPNIPPDWLLALLYAFTERLADTERCSAEEAIQLANLSRLPIEQLHELREFFSEQEFSAAMERYFASLFTNGSAAAQQSTDAFAAPSKTAQGTNRTIDAIEGNTIATEEWGEAPDVGPLFGRETEVAQLTRWILEERCRLIGIFGMGGIGKTSFIRTLTEQVRVDFDFLLWYSLRNAPPLTEIVDESIQFIHGEQTYSPEMSTSKRVTMLVRELRRHRCLLILDGVEAILREGDWAGEYRHGYEEYEDFLRHVGQLPHQSCLLLTSREKPNELALLEDPASPVRTLELEGISVEAAEQILNSQHLSGQPEQWQQLVTSYSGNPMALKLVSEPIRELYGGDIDAFLNSSISIFGGVRELLEAQFSRLAVLERTVLYWLAIEREAVTPDVLLRNLAATASEERIVEALRALRRRSLLEQNATGLTLPDVIMEYLIDRIVSLIIAEIDAELPMMLDTFALVKVQNKEHIRNSQTRLLLGSILKGLRQKYDAATIKAKLLRILHVLRESQPAPSQPLSLPISREHSMSNFAAGNVLNLLAQLKSDLHELNLSRLVIRQADLRGLDLQDVDLSHAHCLDSVFTETFGSVTVVAFNPNGHTLAVGTASGDVRIWHVDERRQFTACTGHTDFVWAAAFSPNGQLLATGSEDQTIRLWEVSTGECVGVLSGHTNWVKGVSFSHDGSLLASCGNDSTIRIWDCETGDSLTAFPAHDGWVWDVEFSPDGYFLASAGQDGLIKLWDTGTDECVRVWDGHEGPVRSLAFSPDGEWLVSGGFDHTVHLRHIASGALRTLAGHESLIWSIAVSPDGEICASGGDDQTIRFWSMRDGSLLRTLRDHHNRVWSIAFSPDGQTLVSGSDDQTLRFWDVVTGQSLLTLEGYSNQIWALVFNEKQGIFASGGDNKRIFLWRIEDEQASSTHRPTRSLEDSADHMDRIRALAFAPNGAILASGGDDRMVRIWDVNNESPLLKLRGHTNRIWAVAVSPHARILASGSEDQTIRLWYLSNGRCFKIIRHQHRVWSLHFSPDGKQLASASDDATIRLWDIVTGQCIRTLPGHSGRVWSVAFSPDGQQLASAGDDWSVRLWDVASGECLHVLNEHTDAVHALAFRSDGALFASGSADQTVRVWNAQTGACEFELTGHTGSVRAVAFGPGHTLVSGGGDEITREWDLRTGCCINEMRANRPYERMNITGLRGLTAAQKSTLKVLGAVEHPIENSTEYSSEE